MFKTSLNLFIKKMFYGFLILFLSLFTYINSLDLVLFNEYFLIFDSTILNSLYFLFPAITLVVLSVMLYFTNKILTNYGFLQTFLISIASIFLFASLSILATNSFCDATKNLTLNLKLIYFFLILFSGAFQLIVLFSSKKMNLYKYISLLIVLFILSGFIFLDLSVFVYETLRLI